MAYYTYICYKYIYIYIYRDDLDEKSMQSFIGIRNVIVFILSLTASGGLSVGTLLGWHSYLIASNQVYIYTLYIYIYIIYIYIYIIQKGHN